MSEASVILSEASVILSEAKDLLRLGNPCRESGRHGNLLVKCITGPKCAEILGGEILRFAQDDIRFAQDDIRFAQDDIRFAQAGPAASIPGAATTAPVLRNIDKDQAETVSAVQLVGDQVLYRRGNTWYSYDMARRGSTDAAGEVVVERFSEEYFRLVREASPADQKVLAAQKDQEEVLIRHPASAKKYRVK